MNVCAVACRYMTGQRPDHIARIGQAGLVSHPHLSLELLHVHHAFDRYLLERTIRLFGQSILRKDQDTRGRHVRRPARIKQVSAEKSS